MTQEEKNLLHKDLCSRLPYGVKVNYSDVACTIDSIGNDAEILLLGEDGEWYPKLEEGLFVSIEKCKPYLFPLSSMTEEQKQELEDMGWSFDNFEINNINECLGTYREYVSHSDCFTLIDWLNKYHFDYRGLIPMGLAKDATSLNIY